MILAWPALGLTLFLSFFVLYMTFVPGLPSAPGLTLKHWANLSDSYLYTRILPNTGIVGIGTVLITLLFACPMAWFLNRTTMPFQHILIMLIAMVAIIPGFIKAMGWLLLFHGRIGIGNKLLMELFGLTNAPFDISGLFGMSWVMGVSLTPTMFFLISGPLQSLDPSLEEASIVAGANRISTLFRVSFPLIWPATFGGIIYTFVTAVSIFEIPALLAGTGGRTPVLATEFFHAAQPLTQVSDPAYGVAGVYGTIIAIPSLIALYFYHRMITQSYRYQTITGRGYLPRRIDLGRYTWIGVTFVAFYLVVSVFLPLLVLVWASVLPVVRFPSIDALALLTLDNYRDLPNLIGGWNVVSNTINLVVSASLLTVFSSFMISWVVVRTRFRFRRTMDFIAMLSHAVPGLAFAFSLSMLAILASRWFPFFPVRGTIAIIVLANIVNRLAYGTRITNAALLQVGRDLEESAWTCGSGTISVMWRILLPLVKPSVAYAGLWTAMLVFREVTMALILLETDNAVLATSIWTIWSRGETPVAAAAAVIMILILGGLMLVTQSFRGGQRFEADRRIF
jgi:iron(III) transport system permease protein